MHSLFFYITSPRTLLYSRYLFSLFPRAALFFFFPLKYGYTALMCACDGGHLDIVKILVAAKAKLDAVDKVSDKR